ncbi:hypothetical protein BKA70DRAFT_1446620 [Coprinopsis sp. MPI-PUGE-AT-0042]|nr:hypothetical protein BKA70DRAFT_1446620 [Coprinopsis sp. MPI-PUGE-AT-0042]
MLSSPSRPPSHNELALRGPQAQSQAPASLPPCLNPEYAMMEPGNQDLAAFFASWISGRESVNLVPLQNLATQDLSNPENQQPQLPASPYLTADTGNCSEHEKQTLGLQMVIQEQQSQLEELRRQIAHSQQRCAYYCEKATTFRALYSQQRRFAEQVMSMLVHLRQSARQQGIVFGQVNPLSSWFVLSL